MVVRGGGGGSPKHLNHAAGGANLEELVGEVAAEEGPLDLRVGLGPLVELGDGGKNHGQQRHRGHLQQHGRLLRQEHVLPRVGRVLVVVLARVPLQPPQPREAVDAREVLRGGSGKCGGSAAAEAAAAPPTTTRTGTSTRCTRDSKGST